LKERSRSVRAVASWAAADFLMSATPRLMPRARFFRMRKRVKLAPTSIPPTAIGRTMKRHRWPAIPDQLVTPAASV
jgi:hypothetical protein